MADPEISFFNKVDGMKLLYPPFGPFSPLITLHLTGGSLIQAGRLLPSISDCFDLSSLQGLLLGWRLAHDQIPAIRDFFGKFPKLTIMNICQCESLPEICLAIAESPKDSSAEGPEETQTPGDPLQRRKSQQSFQAPITVLPALRTLIIESVDFRQRYHPENVEHLIDMLKKRSDIDTGVMRIDRLSIEGCPGLRTWQKRKLGELVVNIEVEGDVIDVKELDSDDDQGDEDGSSDEDEYDYDDGNGDGGDYSDDD